MDAEYKYIFSIKDDIDQTDKPLADEDFMKEFIEKVNVMNISQTEKEFLKRVLRSQMMIHGGLKSGIIKPHHLLDIFKDVKKPKELDSEESNNSLPKSSETLVEKSESKLDNLEEEKKTRKKNRGGKRKGEGKRNFSAFVDSSEIIHHVFPSNFEENFSCPCCGEFESTYKINPSTNVFFRCVTPIVSEIHVKEKIRCSSCSVTLVVKASDEVENKIGSFLPSAATFSILMRYQYGFPYYRMERMIENLNSNLDFSDSTQWDFTQKIALEIEPLLDLLHREAANARWLGVDDSWSRVVSLSKEIKDELENSTNKKEVRTGIETTTFVAETFSGHSIQFYMTGRNHQSENRAAIIELRTNPEPLITMSDATNKAKIKVTSPSGSQIIETHCIEHLRTYFEKIEKDYPLEAKYFLNEIKKIYIHDNECKKQKFNSLARLSFHQTNSREIMDNLFAWIDHEIKNNPFAEPNGSYFRALNYAKKFWKEFTQFLNVSGVKLDNNEVERGTKNPVLQRNNSKKYLTQNGANVGDLFMSLLSTATLNKINTSEYLEFCITYRKILKEDPELFLPWNYLETKKEIEEQSKLAPPYKIASQKNSYDPQEELFYTPGTVFNN